MHRYLSANRRATLLASALVFILAGAACSSTKDEPSSKNPSSGSAAVAVAADGTITLVAKDNTFAPKAFAAPAGKPVRLTLDNQGSAIHNFALIDQKGADGKEIQTALIPGGQTGAVEFTLPAGTYQFHCTVHPAEMQGVLTVQ